MLEIIIGDCNNEVDLESIEIYIRTNMHRVGRMILEKYINMHPDSKPEIKKRCLEGKQAKYVEQREKELMTVLGKIRIKRNYYYDAERGEGFCPKDKELGIEGVSFSPGVQRMMGRVGSNRPFGMSEEDLLELAGLEINAKAIERSCHQLGKEAEEFMEATSEAKDNLRKEEKVKREEIVYISMDGTGVPVIKEETEGRKGKSEDGKSKTREAKLGCIFTQTKLDKDNRPMREESSTTYVGKIETAEDFGKRINQEAVRRGIENAKRVCVIGDGAAWIWNIVEDNFPTALQIIDLYHAREHYWECAKLVYPAKSKRLAQWTERRKTELDQGKVEAVIKAIKRLCPKTEEAESACKSAIHYFEKNKKRMRYNRFRAEGLFVGSGIIEAGCRTVIGQRLKQSGMHWTVSGANSILALRCLLRSGRWEDFWEYRAAA